ncbi:MAG TPA: choice-of-anchor tandem repeat GloVer-containing protein [Candidatus Cybelea sp.]|nr:choice-of-anchor tandem repeat GloVer-containing protein [Candidatus Cybelea sp.]
MKRLSIAMLFSAAFLAACGGGNNGPPASPPISITPQIAAPQSASTGSAPQRLEPSFAGHPRTSVNFKTLYSFKGGKDGRTVAAGLIAVNGVLYGTTEEGGSATGCYSEGGFGCGTAFSVSTTGKEKVIYRSDTVTAFPAAPLVNVNGVLYGTAQGGSNSDGVIFKLTPSGSRYTASVLYNFKGGTDGAEPGAGLIDVNGVLYGTTTVGGRGSCVTGRAGCGTVFSVTTSGQESVLYRFKGGKDGGFPIAGLTDVNGVLYGTTFVGGSSGHKCIYTSTGCGTVFSVTASGQETVLHRFKGGDGSKADGALPEASLTDVGGTLYGTTTNGGGYYNSGIIFKLAPSGTGYDIAYRFNAQPLADPKAALIDVNGVLYGTAGGPIFSYDVASGGVELVYESADSSNSLLYMDGTFYGTTENGGDGPCSGGCGSVFEFTL